MNPIVFLVSNQFVLKHKVVQTKNKFVYVLFVDKATDPAAVIEESEFQYSEQKHVQFTSRGVKFYLRENTTENALATFTTKIANAVKVDLRDNIMQTQTIPVLYAAVNPDNQIVYWTTNVEKALNPITLSSPQTIEELKSESQKSQNKTFIMTDVEVDVELTPEEQDILEEIKSALVNVLE